MPEPNIFHLQTQHPKTQTDRADAPSRFLSLKDVMARTTISRSLLYQLIKDPVRPFPSPVHIGRRSVWIEGEVEAYMKTVIDEERDRI